MKHDLFVLWEEALDLQMEIRTCNPDINRLGGILLRLVDNQVALLGVLSRNIKNERS